MICSSILSGLMLIALTILHARGESITEKKPEFRRYFEEFSVRGSFLLYDLQNDTFSVYNITRAKERFIPASTFKIVHSLIALETEVVLDEHEIIAWDKVDRKWQEWNQDLDMRTAMKHSAVWVYQTFARKIGREMMQDYIDSVNYGNRNISGDIDTFWLEGGLKISSVEQIEFLRQLYEDDLPFSQWTLNIVKDILMLGQTKTHTLYAKTGWAHKIKPQIGWYVGYVEKKGNVYFFATNIERESSEQSLGKLAMTITRNILEELRVL